MAPRKRVLSVERDPEGGWIARQPNGHFIFDKNWRWNSRSAARAAVQEYAERTAQRRRKSRPASSGQGGR